MVYGILREFLIVKIYFLLKEILNSRNKQYKSNKGNEHPDTASIKTFMEF